MPKSKKLKLLAKRKTSSQAEAPKRGRKAATNPRSGGRTTAEPGRAHGQVAAARAASPATVSDDVNHVTEAIVSRVEEAVAARLSDIITEQVTAALAQHQPTDAASQDNAEAELVTPSAARPSAATNQGQATLPLTLGQLVSEADADGTAAGPSAQKLPGQGTNLLSLPAEIVSGSSYPFPLDARITPKLHAKIISGQFVNFADLLDPSRADQSTLTLKTGSKGEVIFYKEKRPTSFKQTVKSITEWDTAFAIYCTIYAQAHPLEVAQLIKYGERVKCLARQGGDWAHCDVGFRCLRQHTPIPWDFLQVELYMEVLTTKLRGSGFNGGSSANQPFLESHVQVPRGYCTRYHRGSHCSGCTYKHTCFKCTAGAHPAINCKRPRTAGSKGGPQSNGKIASHGTIPISAANSSPAPPVSATAGRVRTCNN